MFEAGKGATRGKILAGVADSDEALATVLFPTLGLQVAAKPGYAQWILERECAESVPPERGRFAVDTWRENASLLSRQRVYEWHYRRLGKSYRTADSGPNRDSLQ
jgi:hypothetical protein